MLLTSLGVIPSGGSLIYFCLSSSINFCIILQSVKKQYGTDGKRSQADREQG